MDEPRKQPTQPGKSNRWLEPGPANIQLIYILYLVSFILGITALVGIVFAYINRAGAEGWIETHYTWAIRTFWVGLLFGFISMILMVVGIGFLLMLIVPIWVVVRVVIGLQAVSRNQPISNPQSWML